MDFAQFFQKVTTDIQNDGFSVTTVVGGDNEPTFVYSIGARLKKGAEVLIEGVEHRYAHQILFELISKSLAQRIPLNDSCLIYNLLPEGLPVALIKCDKPSAWSRTAMAARYFDVDDYEVSQLVIPDHNGLFPWDKGCEKQTRQLQTLHSKKAKKPGFSRRVEGFKVYNLGPAAQATHGMDLGLKPSG